MTKLSEIKDAEKHVRDTIEAKRHQKGTADKALTRVKGVNVPPSEQDEKHALVKALRGEKHDADDRIEALRARLHTLRQREAALTKPDDGPASAIKWLIAQDGTTEMPAGSNWGHPVQDWEEFCGYTFAVSWCGCFGTYGLVKYGGAPISQLARTCYGPDIIADAHAGANGLHAVAFAEIKGGELLSYWNGEHIGVARGPAVNGSVPTVEGNTSPSEAGNQYNGGCVALKVRTLSDVTVAARWW